jgi:hypothetical protein
LLYLFDANGLFVDLKIDTRAFFHFAFDLNNGYKDITYHNRLHAFDVTQTVHFFLRTCKFEELADLSEIEIAAMYVGCAGHDLAHP